MHRTLPALFSGKTGPLFCRLTVSLARVCTWMGRSSTLLWRPTTSVSKLPCRQDRICRHLESLRTPLLVVMPMHWQQQAHTERRYTVVQEQMTWLFSLLYGRARHCFASPAGVGAEQAQRMGHPAQGSGLPWAGPSHAARSRRCRQGQPPAARPASADGKGIAAHWLPPHCSSLQSQQKMISRLSERI